MDVLRVPDKRDKTVESLSAPYKTNKTRAFGAPDKRDKTINVLRTLDKRDKTIEILTVLR